MVAHVPRRLINVLVRKMINRFKIQVKRMKIGRKRQKLRKKKIPNISKKKKKK